MTRPGGGTLYRHLGGLKALPQTLQEVRIEARPAVVDARSRIGDREGDTIVGKGRRAVLLTRVECRSLLYVRTVRLRGRQAGGLARALVQDRVKFDNGHEFSRHEEIGKSLGANV